MTSASAPVQARGWPAVPPPAHHVGFGHVMLAEWTKIRSVRSTVWTLLLFAVISLGLTGLLTWLTVHSIQQGNGGRDAAATISADPTSFILGTGLGLGQLAICVLGVLVITSEYSTGTIRASFLAVPKRLPVLAAKVAVFSRAGPGHRRDRRVRLVLHRLGTGAQPGPGLAERPERDPRRDRGRPLPDRARLVRAGHRPADPAYRGRGHHGHRPGPGDREHPGAAAG